MSNFTKSHIEYDGRVFPSVEHAFAYAKYKHSSGTGPDFTISGDHANTFGGDIKKLHGRKHMQSIGCVLNVERFDEVKEQVMRDLIASRVKHDADFRRILRPLQTSHTIIHQENRGRNPYWGGRIKDGELVGKNVLGKIMQSIPLPDIDSSVLGSRSRDDSMPTPKKFKVTKAMCTGSLLQPDVPCEHSLRFAMNCLRDAVQTENAKNVSAAFRMICIITNSFPADPVYTLPILVDQDDCGFHEKMETMLMNGAYDELEKFVCGCCNESIARATHMARGRERST